jgi:RNA polymerase sigma factor (sigma-70 family)
VARFTEDERWFAGVFGEFSSRVYGYARRHTDAAAAEDVAAETFLVGWRRRDVLPRDDPLPWLIAVARNVLRNRGRRLLRDDQLVAAWAAMQPVAQGGADDQVAERQALFAALTTLTDREREAVLLVGWDGLTAAQAGLATGCSPKAFEVRLARGRARLTRALADGDDSRRMSHRSVIHTGEAT